MLTICKSLFFLVFFVFSANGLVQRQNHLLKSGVFYCYFSLFTSCPRQTIFFPCKKTFQLDFSGLCVSNCLFCLAKNLIAPNYPTYPWRTVFLPGKKTFQLDFSGLCVANCLFFLAKNLIAPNYPIYAWQTVFSSRNDPCDYRG